MHINIEPCLRTESLKNMKSRERLYCIRNSCRADLSGGEDFVKAYLNVCRLPCWQDSSEHLSGGRYLFPDNRNKEELSVTNNMRMPKVGEILL